MALLDDLKVFYEFENNGEDAHTVGPYDLTADNSPTFDTGVVNTAAEFDGSSFPSVQIFRVASNTDLENGNIDFSYAGWVYLTSVAATRYVIGRWGETQSTHRSFALEFQTSTNKFRFLAGNGTSTTDVLSSSFAGASVNTWYYVAFGHRASTDRLWISVDAGTIDTAIFSTSGVLAGSARLVFGGLDTGDGSLTDLGLPGRLDQWGYWKRDISSDLSTLYNGGSGMSYADMSGVSPPAAALTLSGQSLRLGFQINLPDEP